MKLETDGIEYDILERCIEKVVGIPGCFLEIGTRKGGSMQIIIDAAIRSGQKRDFVSVDPYGNIPYNDGQAITRYDYTNEMKCTALSDLYRYALQSRVNLVTFTMTDILFFKWTKAGIPIYDQECLMEQNVAFAFLDGPHDVESISEELYELTRRTHAGAILVIDNIDLFEPEKLNTRGFWKEIERNNQKIAYVKL